jgi:hypothetical protein
LRREDITCADIPGAPFRIGDEVQVVRLSDETAYAKFLGRCGQVLYFDYSCGCGQRYPDDPMIGVQFLDGSAEFWKEEIQRIGLSQDIR